ALFVPVLDQPLTSNVLLPGPPISTTLAAATFERFQTTPLLTVSLVVVSVKLASARSMIVSAPPPPLIEFTGPVQPVIVNTFALGPPVRLAALKPKRLKVAGPAINCVLV